MQTATGDFEVKRTPADDDSEFDAGRFLLDKKYHGVLEAVGKGQMLSQMSPVEGSAAYVAIETVVGTLDGRRGSFALVHRGVMKGASQELLVTVVPDSGTEELAGLKGTMTIRIADGKHYYDFEYSLAN